MGQPPRDPFALMRLLLTVPLSRHVEDLISSKAAGADKNTIILENNNFPFASRMRLRFRKRRLPTKGRYGKLQINLAIRHYIDFPAYKAYDLHH